MKISLFLFFLPIVCTKFAVFVGKKKKKAHQSLSITDVQENISSFLASDDYSNKREQRVKLSYLSCHKTVLWKAWQDYTSF